MKNRNQRKRITILPSDLEDDADKIAEDEELEMEFKEEKKIKKKKKQSKKARFKMPRWWTK